MLIVFFQHYLALNQNGFWFPIEREWFSYNFIWSCQCIVERTFSDEALTFRVSQNCSSLWREEL